MLRSVIRWLTPILLILSLSFDIQAQCNLSDIDVTPLCNADGTYDLEVCFTHTPQLFPLVDIEVEGEVLAEDVVTTGALQCVMISNVDQGDNESGKSVFIREKIVIISEIHYDNTGADVNEGIEVSGIAGLDLNGWSLVIYNGGDNEVQTTENLTGVIPDAGSGCGAIFFPIASIQNDTEAIALVDPDANVLEFLSYEGVITAADGPAIGMTSVDIGVDEQPAPAVGNSLQRTDLGWQEPMASSYNMTNLTCACQAEEIYDEECCVNIMPAMFPLHVGFCGEEGSTLLEPEDYFGEEFLVEYLFENVTTGSSSTLLLDVADAQIGPGVDLATDPFPSGNNSENSYSLDGWSTGALIEDDYLEICLEVPYGKSINLENFSFDERRSSSGPETMEIYYSMDDFMTPGIQIPIPDGNLSGTNFTSHEYNPSIAADGSLCIRIFGYDAGSSVGTWRFDNMSLSGNIGIASNIDFFFYDGHPDMGGTELAGPVDSYDPMVDINSAPQTFWVVASDGSCESEVITVTVHRQTGEETFACGELLNISAPSGCEVTITPDMVMKGPPIFAGYVELFDENGQSLGSTVGPEYFGIILDYRMYDDCGPNLCWGQLQIEDKLVPETTCDLMDIDLGSIDKQDLDWVKEVIKKYADGLVCEMVNEESGECESYTEIPAIPFSEHNIELIEPNTAIYLNEFCIEDNCQDVFDIKWDLYAENDAIDECVDPLEILDVYHLVFYLEYQSPHGDLQTIIVASYFFEVLRPDFPEFPHDVTVYCIYGNDITPEGIARQKNNIFDCDMHEDCEYGEEGDDCDNGIPYAWPYWDLHDDCYQSLKTNLTHGYCKYFASWGDEILDDNCCKFKLARHWTIVDWCSSEVRTEYQVIERHDLTAPKLVGDPPHPLSVGIEPWLCTADIEIPNNAHSDLEVWDGCCEAFIRVSIHEFTGSTEDLYAVDLEDYAKEVDFCSNYGGIIGEDYEDLRIGDQITISEGYYIIKYQAIDECGNVGDFECVPLWVLDVTPPVPVCHDQLTVSLTIDHGLDGGVAKLSAKDMDLGSHDLDCGPVFFKAIRMDELYDTEHGYWNNFGLDDGPDYTRPPQQVLFPGEICEGANGDDFPDVISTNDKGNLQFYITFDQFFFDDEIKYCCADQGEEIYAILRVFDIDPGEGPVDPRRMEALDYGGISGYDEQTNDISGHYNDCMVRIRVDNKIQAAILCAKPLYYLCDTYPDTDLEAEAHAPTVDALCGETELYYEDIVSLDDCQRGLVSRVWKATSNGQVVAQCTQYIYVGTDQVFDPRSIKWPPHQTGEFIHAYQIECIEGTDESEIIGEINTQLPPHLDCMDASYCMPEWEDTSCGLIGFSLESDTVYFEDESCIKIVNHWTVIDWCTWHPNCEDDYSDRDDDWAWFEDWSLGICTKESCFNDGTHNLYASFVADCTVEFGYYDGPASSDCPKHDLPGFYLDCFDGDAEDCFSENPENDRCGVVVDGFYVWDQVIKVINSTPPVIAMDMDDETTGICVEPSPFPVDDNCMGHLVLKNSASDDGDCPINRLHWYIELFDAMWNPLDYWDITTENGANIHIDENSNNADGWDEDDKIELEQPAGTYIVRWTVSDGCNNEAICIQYLKIEDITPPTPICAGVGSTALMQPSGEVQVWATDFDIKSYDNCTPEEDLSYSIKRIFTEDDPTASVTITCPMMNSSPIQLQMWVSDTDGNSSWCQVLLFVSDETGICDNNESFVGTIAGSLATEDGEPIEKASVRLNGPNSNYPFFLNTGNQGIFEFINNPRSGQYGLSVQRIDNPMNGVSTRDMLMIQRHILQEQKLSSPYKVIAADINSDETVSAMDLVELRQLIIGAKDQFANNTSWRFVDASQEMEVDDPFPFIENRNIPDLSIDRLNEDFIGVKIGDVTGDVRAHDGVDLEIRYRHVLNLILEDEFVRQGELVEIDFRSSNFRDIYGFQLSLNHPGLEYITYHPRRVHLGDNNIGVHSGEITMSWHNIHGVTEDEVLFSLVFRAQQAGNLSERLSVFSGITRVEAYSGENYDVQDIQLAFTGTSDYEKIYEFGLGQNHPNPFSEETIIPLTVSGSGEVKLEILDLSGSVMYKENRHLERGEHKWILNMHDIGRSGIYYYRLEFDDQSLTKKMIVID